MKKSISLLLVLILLLAGCGVQTEPTDGTTMGTVPDLFTQPTTVPQETTKPAEVGPTLPDRDIPVRLSLGFGNKEMVYSGGEHHMSVKISWTEGYSNVGLGLLVIVDGQPQPYRTAEDDTVSYMHIFYPEDDVEYQHEFIFTPVSGKVGETVDVHIMGFNDPTFCIGDGEVGAHFRFLSPKASLTFEAAPGAQEVPAVADAQLSWSSAYVDATGEEIGLINAAQMQQEIRYNFTLNDKDRENQFYGTAEGDKVTFHLEVYGMPYVGYGLVIYVDGEPVAINSEDMILFDIHNGQKTVVEGEFTLTGFDGSSNVCVLLVPRNSTGCGVENKLSLEDIGVYYFVSAASYEDLLEQINQ